MPNSSIELLFTYTKPNNIIQKCDCSFSCDVRKNDFAHHSYKHTLLASGFNILIDSAHLNILL